ASTDSRKRAALCTLVQSLRRPWWSATVWSVANPLHASGASMRAYLYFALVVVCLLPSTLHAQGVIAGHVRDSSGGPVADAVVEVQSPAIIEGVRETMSDRSGRYRIEALPPGR